MFRNRERGALHHPEFTMLEWYRANEPYEMLMDDCAALLAEAARAAGDERVFVSRQDHRSLRRAGAHHRGRGFHASCRHRSAGDGRAAARATAPRSAAAAEQAGVRIADDDTWGDIFSRVLAERVEPHLGVGRATILMSIRCRWRRWRGRNRAATRSPSASSSMPAASNSPMPSAN